MLIFMFQNGSCAPAFTHSTTETSITIEWTEDPAETYTNIVVSVDDTTINVLPDFTIASSFVINSLTAGTAYTVVISANGAELWRQVITPTGE